jgi:predicted deacetylase
MSKYLIRLDDITPDMDWECFSRCMKIFSLYRVRPILGIIPDNKDKSISRSKPLSEFWEIIKDLVLDKAATIAQHGYQHIYRTKKFGLLGQKYGFKPGSEFAGLSYNQQNKMIKAGKTILNNKGLFTTLFMAPNHSFDTNTIKALTNNGFSTITDGIALFPFQKFGIKWIPQVFWKVRQFPFGIITFCLHPNNMENEDFIRLEKFLKKNTTVSFEEIINIKPTIIHTSFNIFFIVGYLFLRALSRIIRN